MMALGCYVGFQNAGKGRGEDGRVVGKGWL